MRKRPFATRLAAIAGAGLAIRLVYALAVMGRREPTGDGHEFHYLANVLAATGRYLQPFMYAYLGRSIPTTEKPPLYPTVLALPSLLGLDSVAAHRVVTCLLGTAAVVLIGLLGRKVAGPRVGLIAAGVAAVYPALWMLDASLRSESLYVALIALVLLLAYRLVERPGPRRAAPLGLAIGLAALTRSEALFLLVLLGVPLLLLVPRGGRVRLAAALVLGCLVVVGPWLARNWITFHQPTAISTNEGGLLAGANCDTAYYNAAFIGTWACFPRNDPAWGENEAVIAGHLRSRAFEYVSDHAARVPAVVGVRILRVWDLYRPLGSAHFEASIADRDLHAQQAAMGSLYLLVPFAVAGAVLLRRRGRPLRILLLPVVFVTLVAALTYGSTRFRVAAEPAIVVLASVAIAAAWDRVRRRGGEAAAAAEREMQPA
jgi:4-amino-4-deoxy-L-arabinose transferase-like glycosyltransferase